jgi:hypothetical protein
MSIDWTQAAGFMLVLFAIAFFYVQFRFKPRATKEIKTGADLQQRIGRNSYTLVQLFAPM